MPHKIASRLMGLFLLAFGTLPALAQQFSADLVRLKPEGAAPSKVFVSGDRMRFEAGSGQHLSVIVADLKQQTGYMMLPEDKTYSMLQPGRISPTMPFFQAANPEDACAAWEKLVNKPGTCTKVGDETINGRVTVKYKGTAQNGDTGSAWVDRKLRFVIKWEGEAGASELRNIQEGPQPVMLFEIPKGYQRMDARVSRQELAKKKAKGSRAPAQKPQN
ncbi:MAG TPA: hypothetical protein VE398_26355 [Acidobacteriota bacterium]|nr:hypothetical protein [Acidobacteriota bacterium]